jgi:ABC-type glycerol-3-phosphate transport system permease component
LLDLLHDIIELYRLTLIILYQANAIEIEQDFAQSAIIAAVYPENRLEIYDSVFQDNLYNQPFVQVSLASLAVSVSLVVVWLAVCSLSSFVLLFSLWDPP